jgi:hypothetical protein
VRGEGFKPSEKVSIIVIGQNPLHRVRWTLEREVNDHGQFLLYFYPEDFRVPPPPSPWETEEIIIAGKWRVIVEYPKAKGAICVEFTVTEPTEK